MKKSREHTVTMRADASPVEALAARFLALPRALYRRSGLEFFFWSGALIAMAVAPIRIEPHFTLCPFALAGFTLCPGCGLGRSLSFLLHGDIAHSVEMHLLGIPALCIIVARCVALLRRMPRDRAVIPTLP